MNDIPQIPENVKQQVLNSIRNLKTRFCFVPSPRLKELVTRNEHPFITPLPSRMKQDILTCRPGQAIGALDRYLVERYVLGMLDERQKFILDNSDVRVMNESIGTHPDVAK